MELIYIADDVDAVVPYRVIHNAQLVYDENGIGALPEIDGYKLAPRGTNASALERAYRRTAIARQESFAVSSAEASPEGAAAASKDFVKAEEAGLKKIRKTATAAERKKIQEEMISKGA